MPRPFATLVAFLVCLAARGADEPSPFAGDWKTTFRPVCIGQKEDDVTGQIVAFKLLLKGKLDGKKLRVGYDEGQIQVDATLELDPSGNAFCGTFQASNGKRGVWNGWLKFLEHYTQLVTEPEQGCSRL
jgi:hypothetical protein